MNDETKRLLTELSEGDVKGLVEKGQDYGDSWKKRGGVGAFMMLARKWDRLEGQVQKEPKWDVFEHGTKDQRLEGLLDDISDLRRYLLLVEAEIRERRKATIQRNPVLDYTRKFRTEGGPYLGSYEIGTTCRPDGTSISYTHRESNICDATGQTHPFGFDPYQDALPDPNVSSPSVSVRAGETGGSSSDSNQ